MMNDPQLWHRPNHKLHIKAGELHIWRVFLSYPVTIIQELVKYLEEKEKQQASRFYFEKDRHHFIISRALLKLLLSKYLRRTVQEIKFKNNEYGKPSLVTDGKVKPLRFNMSHSNGIALYAFTNNQEVGIDIEYIKEDIEAAQIAKNFFSAFEFKQLKDLSHDLQKIAFFNGWTRKEAFIKAKGMGLYMPLDSFDMQITPGQPAKLLAVKDNPDETYRWQVKELYPAGGFAAAVVVEGKIGKIQQFEWDHQMFDDRLIDSEAGIG